MVGPQSTTAETTLVGELLLELEDDDDEEEEEDEDDDDDEDDDELDCELPPLSAVAEAPLELPPPPHAARLATASPARTMTAARIEIGMRERF